MNYGGAGKGNEAIASLQAEAAGYRSQGKARRDGIPDKMKRVLSLALPIKQGKPEAIEEAAKLRAEIAADREEAEISEAAALQLDGQIADELHAEHKRLDRHSRRKTKKTMGELPGGVKDLERYLGKFVETYAGVLKRTEQVSTPWRDTWPQKPSVLYQQTIQRLVAHALYVALRDAGIKLPEPRYTERDFQGLYRTWQQQINAVSVALLSDDPTLPVEVEAEEPAPVEPVKVPADPYVTDEEIARRNADGTAATMPGWVLSGREIVLAREAEKAKEPVMPRDVNPFTGEEI